MERMHFTAAIPLFATSTFLMTRSPPRMRTYSSIPVNPPLCKLSARRRRSSMVVEGGDSCCSAGCTAGAESTSCEKTQVLKTLTPQWCGTCDDAKEVLRSRPATLNCVLRIAYCIQGDSGVSFLFASMRGVFKASPVLRWGIIGIFLGIVAVVFSHEVQEGSLSHAHPPAAEGHHHHHHHHETDVEGREVHKGTALMLTFFSGGAAAVGTCRGFVLWVRGHSYPFTFLVQADWLSSFLAFLPLCFWDTC
jgi:hypothetical protein